ncbi:MAG: response regulator [Labilithrix sp.]|nr:response regulator [Labilithrix sp.]MBX3224451.1 response regulator [Labilithrix sp.]
MLHDAHRAPQRSPTTVLVVEDDGDLRELVVDTLRRDGYVVLAAGSASEAARILAVMVERRGVDRQVDLVLSDVRMNGGTGLDLAHRLRATSARLPIILMTAFPEPDLEVEAEDVGATLLAKPFRLEVLRRAVLTTIAAHVRSLA